jgi:inorganic pyrophosphatase
MSFPKPFYRWRPHPWHGLEVGPKAPELVHAYIEITPFDSMKYEIDKVTGYLVVDRPQRTSSRPPALYGFIPRTFCGSRISALSPKSTKGDGDPLDICIISEQPITRGEVVVTARVVGGLQMIDDGEADDKIIAVLEKDNVWGEVRDIHELPQIMIERLRHYFSTYKMKPGQEVATVIEWVYGREQALKVIEAAMEDYDEAFGQ